MVCLGWKTCHECGETYQGNIHNTNEDTCGACASARVLAEETAYLDKMLALPRDEQLRYIFKALFHRERGMRTVEGLFSEPPRYA